MDRGETKVIRLERTGVPPPPWGFRLQGGANFETPLSIQLVNPGSVADFYGLQAGDAVLRINNLPTQQLEHDDAKAEIMRSGDAVEMMIQRGGVQVWKPSVTRIERPQHMDHQQFGEPADDYMVQRTSLAANKMEPVRIGSTHNRAAAPFPGGGSPGGSPSVQRTRQVVHNPYNSPMGLYSQNNAATAYQGQTQGVGGDGVPVQHYGGGLGGGSPYSPATQQMAGGAPQGMRSVTAPSKPAGWTPPANTQTLPKCWKCGNSIVKSRGLRSSGVFMKVRGQPLHPDCLKCCKCGQNLKNVGYCIHEDDFYCETHYKQAVQRPDNVLHLSGKVVYQ